MQVAKQLSFIPEVNEKEVRNTVIKELKTYRSLKIQAENRKEQKEKESLGYSRKKASPKYGLFSIKKEGAANTLPY
nr:hypothetical protein [Bacillus atrophaeus]